MKCFAYFVASAVQDGNASALGSNKRFLAPLMGFLVPLITGWPVVNLFPPSPGR